MTSIKRLVQESSLSLLETHLLLQKALGVGRTWLIAHDDKEPNAEQLTEYKSLLARRVAGEPIAYILGNKEFFGHEFIVNSAVLVPRPETELLVQSALDFIANRNQANILDLGTGSGAIAISIALARPDANVVATDYSPEALQVAKMNAQHLGAKLNFYTANWYDTGLSNKLLHNHFDLIVANPPYVSEHDDHLNQGDLRFEPKMALTDFADGLSAIRHIVQHAPEYLAAGGGLYMEHGWDQAASARQILAQHGFTDIHSKQDLAGIERITCGLYRP